LEVLLEDLPENWDAKTPKLNTQTIGDDFVFENDAAIERGSNCFPLFSSQVF
jgi:hypothetical protein